MKTAKKTILVVDDDQGIIETMRDILQYAGHEVDVANNAMDAIKLYGSKCYDLVLMDVRMPGMNGIESCKTMKITRNQPNIVFITAYVDNDAVTEFDKEHCDFLLKPVNMERLTTIIDHCGI